MPFLWLSRLVVDMCFCTFQKPILIVLIPVSRSINLSHRYSFVLMYSASMTFIHRILIVASYLVPYCICSSVCLTWLCHHPESIAISMYVIKNTKHESSQAVRLLRSCIKLGYLMFYREKMLLCYSKRVW